MSSFSVARQRLPRLLLIALAAGLWMPAFPAFAQQVQAPATGPSLASESEPVDLTVANRTIFTLRADAFGRPPRDRVATIQPMVGALVERGGPLEVTTAETGEGVVVMVDGSLLFRVLNGDVNPETGETPQSVAAQAVSNLKVALHEMREARDARSLLPAILHSLAATVIGALVLWLLWRSYRWLFSRLRAAIHRRVEHLVPKWGRSILGPSAVERALVAPVRLGFWLVAFLVVYEWLAYVLGRFPYTRPWGEALFANLASAVGELLGGIAHALPGLFFVVVIFY